MGKIPKQDYQCPECGLHVHIWHRVDPRDGYTGKGTPFNVGCPECNKFMELKHD